MYLSYELSKGEESFYYPFFQILPQPANISTWVQSELNELQVWNECLCLAYAHPKIYHTHAGRQIGAEGRQ